MEQLNSFEGCKLYAVKYEGDEVSKKNLEYCNSLAADGVTYSESIVFTSYFRSPVFGGGALSAKSDNGVPPFDRRYVLFFREVRL